MAIDSFVHLRNVSKSYGAKPAIEGIDLEVQRGDFVSLIGPSGCGKSTLLRMIAGLTPPSTGEIRIEGRSSEAARREMFFVFQDATLLPWRRVAENVGLPLELRREPPERRKSRVLEMLRLVDLEAAADQYPWQLSGGMRMRASLARALSIAPRILLMDEPFGSLDEMSRDQLNEELLAVRERAPFTAFFVTHSVAEAVFLSNRILVLNSGSAVSPLSPAQSRSGVSPLSLAQSGSGVSPLSPAQSVSAIPASPEQTRGAASLPAEAAGRRFHSFGSIAAQIEVPFAYPRRSPLREDPKFLQILAETTAALRAVRPAVR